MTASLTTWGLPWLLIAVLIVVALLAFAAHRERRHPRHPWAKR